MTSYKIILAIFLFLLFFNFSLNKASALPIGTLLYRTSSDGRLYGLNEDELIKVKKGIIKKKIGNNQLPLINDIIENKRPIPIVNLEAIFIVYL